MKRRAAAYVRKSKKLEESAAAQLVAIQEVAARDGVSTGHRELTTGNLQGAQIRLAAARLRGEPNQSGPVTGLAGAIDKLLGDAAKPNRCGRSSEPGLRGLRQGHHGGPGSGPDLGPARPGPCASTGSGRSRPRDGQAPGVAQGT